MVKEELETIAREVGQARMESGRYNQARDLFVRLSTSETLEEFLTLPAYDIITTEEKS
jgi:malate synthase